MADTGEVLVHLAYIREGIDGLNSRLDVLNGRTRALETDVAVLHDRANLAVTAAAAARSSSRASAVKWGAGMGALLAGLIAGLAQAFGAK